MKKNKVKQHFLDELKRIPIIQVGAEKCGISRNSVYRWRKEDKKFEKAMDEALADGEALVNDMSESQVLSLIKEKNWNAISFWLRHRNPRFRDSVDINAKIERESENLTKEQEIVVREALRLVTKKNKHERNTIS